MSIIRYAVFLAVATTVVLLHSAPDAYACGCFAAPSPAFPVVQAGEKILFVREGTTISAHIQIQYEGEAEEFGWLIPMPAVPEVRLGVEELFVQLEAATNPSFLLSIQGGGCDDGESLFACGSQDSRAGVAFEDVGNQNPNPEPVVVEQGSAGPFEFAVVRADDKGPMLEWLQDNRYVVPEGGENLLDPYVREGAFFLALKLRSGQSTGDLQPIVIEYEADQPMIPLILTQLGAIVDMGVLTWILGDVRAVPTNYRHVQINEEYIDWFNAANNYADVVARAVDEAENGHAFVTEYAGTSDLMVGVLDPPGRFGRRDTFEATTDAIEYVNLLGTQLFPMDAIRSILERTFPMPAEVIDQGIQPDEYYQNLGQSLARFDPNPAGFDPVALTQELWERVVAPTIATGALFRRHDYLTRLYTAISPREMTVDPAFDFNPDLPDVSNQHLATIVQQCDPDDEDNPWEMTLSDGRQYYVRSPGAWSLRDERGAPRTTTIEVMGLEGAPTIEVDNRASLRAMSGPPGGGGCQNLSRSRWSGLVNLALIFGSVFAMRRFLARRHQDVTGRGNRRSA